MTIFIQNGFKKLFGVKKVVNLLNSAVKTLHNTNYCLSLTILGLKSDSTEPANLKKRLVLKD